MSYFCQKPCRYNLNFLVVRLWQSCAPVSVKKIQSLQFSITVLPWAVWYNFLSITYNKKCSTIYCVEKQFLLNHKYNYLYFVKLGLRTIQPFWNSSDTCYNCWFGKIFERYNNYSFTYLCYVVQNNLFGHMKSTCA